MAEAGTPFDALQVGDELPPRAMPPVTRAMLALFAGASGDHNPIHTDLDVARRAGLPDVFAHGMLGMAWLGRLLTGWAPQHRLRRFDARFQGITHLQHLVTCQGRIVEKRVDGGERRVRVELRTVNQYHQVLILGEAELAWP
jgi:acyl dehydratase